MAKFYINHNNGVTVVAPVHVIEEQKKTQEDVGDQVRVPAKPVFTFTNLARRPQMKQWVTGNYNILPQLLKGHETARRELYVPFSNGYETGIHGPKLREYEAQFVTSLDEAMEAFGLGRVE